MMVFFTALMAMAFTLNLFGKGMIVTLMTVMGLVCMYRYMSLKLWRHTRLMNGGFVLIALGAISWFASGLMGLNSAVSIEKWAVLSFICAMAFVIKENLEQGSFDVLKFYQWTSGLLIICAFIVLGCFAISYTNLLSLEIKVSNLYGSVMALGVPFLLYLAIHSARHRVWWWGGTIVAMAAIFALGGRTGYAALLVSGIGFLFFYPWSSIRQMIVTSIKTILSICIGGVSGLFIYYASVGGGTYQSRVGNINMDRPASGRLHIWEKCIDYFQDNPYFGVGIKGFRELFLTADDGNQVLHAHNIVLELLIDTGTIGTLLFLAAISWFVMHFIAAYIHIKDKTVRALYLPIFIGFIGYGVASMALTSIFHTWWFLYMVLFVVLLAVGTHQMRQVKRVH